MLDDFERLVKRFFFLEKKKCNTIMGVGNLMKIRKYKIFHIKYQPCIVSSSEKMGIARLLCNFVGEINIYFANAI